MIQIPCRVLIIPSGPTTNNVIAPEYMVPLYRKLWAKQIATDRTDIKVEMPSKPMFKEVPSVADEKIWLQTEKTFRQVFDAVYPDNTFEYAVEQIFKDEAKREEEIARGPVLPPIPADFKSVRLDDAVSYKLIAQGITDLKGLVNSPITALVEAGLSPGAAVKVQQQIANILLDEAKKSEASDKAAVAAKK